MSLDHIEKRLRDIPDFPKPGILFKDITPILGDPDTFRACIQVFKDRYQDMNLDAIVAIDARGFLFGAALAHDLELGLVPVRKQRKLPYSSLQASYELEYGSATLEVHEDALSTGDRVIIIDDLLATGGTAKAAAELVDQLGAEVVELAFLIEIAALEGREKLAPLDVFAPIISRD